jgi:hypothetical protein
MSALAVFITLAAAAAALTTCAAGGVALSGQTSGSRDVVVPFRGELANVILAFNGIRALGLCVSVTQSMSISSLRIPSADLQPPPGTHVQPGSIVAITPGLGPVGSPAVEKSNPRYRVPDFVGEPASAVVSWTEHTDIFWSIPTLPPHPSTCVRHLLDAYRVTGQQPKPGSWIREGVAVGRSYRPTPLTLTVTPE